MIEQQFTLTKWTGFSHPATMLVTVSSKFNSKIVLQFNGENVNLKNQNSPKTIMDLIKLGIRPGLPFTIIVDGVDEVEAIQTIDKNIFICERDKFEY